MTPASGPNNQGCFQCESSGDMEGSGSGSGSGGMGECDSCDDTKFGCCPDGLRAAKGPMGEGCEESSKPRPITFFKNKFRSCF